MSKQRRKAPALSPLIWVGGKSRRVAQLRELVGSRAWDETYIVEPFAGSAAFTLHALAQGPVGGASLYDAPGGVALFWQALARQPTPAAHGDAIRALGRRFPTLTAERFAELRAHLNALRADGVPSPSLLAAFLAVNWAGFNGLWRTNAKGACNTPWGKWDLALDWPVMERQITHTCGLIDRAILAGVWDARVAGADAAILHDIRVARGCGHHPLVFVDPPYPGTYSGYAGPWVPENYATLRRACEGWADAGADVAITFPAAHAQLLPRGWELRPFDMPDLVSCRGATRTSRAEVLCVSPARRLA